MSAAVIWRRTRYGKEADSEYEGVSKSFRTIGRLERELQVVQLSATRCSCIAILWVSLVSFVAITLWRGQQRIIPKVSIFFVIDSVRKLLVTPPGGPPPPPPPGEMLGEAFLACLEVLSQHSHGRAEKITKTSGQPVSWPWFEKRISHWVWNKKHDKIYPPQPLVHKI
jgi:hypothetical protein